MKKYPAFKPYFSKNASVALEKCINEKSISGNYGEALKDFEVNFSRLHDDYHPVSCTSGTSALHLACLGLGINESHTVVVPSSTNMATFFAPMYCSAKVIACDVNRKDGLINIESLIILCEKEKIDFVFIVHLYGHVVDPIKINFLAAKYNFKVIEDCAEAHFAKPNSNSNYVGSNHDASCFSFYANKIISGGEGGLVLFKEKENFEKAKNLKNLAFGNPQECPSKFYHQQIGFNYRLPNTVASLILDSLESRELILKKREQIANWYNYAFKEKIYIDYLHSELESYRVNWVYCIRIKDKFINKFKSKNQFLAELSAIGIEARDFFYPANRQPFFNKYCLKKGYENNFNNSNAMEFYKNSIYLPVYLDLEENDIKVIVKRIDKLLID